MPEEKLYEEITGEEAGRELTELSSISEGFGCFHPKCPINKVIIKNSEDGEIEWWLGVGFAVGFDPDKGYSSYGDLEKLMKKRGEDCSFKYISEKYMNKQIGQNKSEDKSSEGFEVKTTYEVCWYDDDSGSEEAELFEKPEKAEEFFESKRQELESAY